MGTLAPSIITAQDARGETGLDLPMSSEEQRVIAWAEEGMREGDAFLKSQPGYPKIDECIRLINGDPAIDEIRSMSLSSTSINSFGKVARDMVASLTDVRPFWEYRTHNKRYEPQAELSGKLSLHWWLQRYIDLRWADVIRYALVAGTGWAHLTYDQEIDDLRLQAEDPRDVLPIRPADMYDIQSALGVIIRRERPTSYLKARYPEKADLIKTDREGSFGKQQSSSRIGRMMSTLGLSPLTANLRMTQAPVATLNIPVTDLFTIYVKDRSKNTSGRDLHVGAFDGQGRPINTWSYVVKPGEMKYPRGRCIMLTRTAILYDGPNIYWHGLFPLAKITLDPWPWTFLGIAPMWDLLPIQRALDRNVRIVDDHNEQVARPWLIGDKNAMPKAAMDRLDLRRAGAKVMHNPLAGKAIQVQQANPLDASVPEYIKYLHEKMEELPGVRDLSMMMRLSQLPSAEGMERVLESMSLSVRARSRVLEAAMRDFAKMVAAGFMQFYTVKQRMAIIGTTGATFEDFDFDPGNMVPDFINDEDFDDSGALRPEALARGPLPRAERAKVFLNNLSFHIAPASLLNAASATKKMLYLQLARMGWMDLWTLYDVLEIPNVGSPPEGADSIPDRLAAQAQMGIGMDANPAGRKASGQQMPRMKISESG